MVKKSDH